MKSVMQSNRAGAISPAIVILILCLGGVGSLGTLWWLGDLNLPGLDHLRDGDGAGSEEHAGQIAVPLAAREIPAYTKVRRDDFWLPETSEFATVWLDEDVVRERGIMTAKQVLNRVLAIDKKKGYAFSEDDFLPLGTREGPAAGIEPGMRGLRVAADSIRGLHGLRRGDRFDLIATQNVESKQGAKGHKVSPLAEAAHADDKAWEDVSTRIIVQNGKLVEPVRARQSIAENGMQMKQVEEAFLGVAEEEVTRLTEALALGAKILCVPRSALPGAGGRDLMAHSRPAGPGVVEVYSNGKRSLTYVPRGRDYAPREEYSEEYDDWDEAAQLDLPVAEELTEEEELPLEEATLVEASFEPEPLAVVEPLVPEAAAEPEPEAVPGMHVSAEQSLEVEEVTTHVAAEVVARAEELIEEHTESALIENVMDAIVAQELGTAVEDAVPLLTASLSRSAASESRIVPSTARELSKVAPAADHAQLALTSSQPASNSLVPLLANPEPAQHRAEALESERQPIRETHDAAQPKAASAELLAQEQQTEASPDAVAPASQRAALAKAPREVSLEVPREASVLGEAKVQLAPTAAPTAESTATSTAEEIAAPVAIPELPTSVPPTTGSDLDPAAATPVVADSTAVDATGHESSKGSEDESVLDAPESTPSSEETSSETHRNEAAEELEVIEAEPQPVVVPEVGDGKFAQTDREN